MVTNFKIFEKIRRWKFKNDKYLYHYTSYENVISILNDGFIKKRERSIYNKYSGTDDYGYVSLTEDEEYHSEDHGGVPTEVRFVFNKKLMNKKYNLQRFNANKEAVNIYKYDMVTDYLDNLSSQNIPYYGNEYEVRIHENISIFDVKIIESYDNQEFIQSSFLNLLLQKNKIKNGN